MRNNEFSSPSLKLCVIKGRIWHGVGVWIDPWSRAAAFGPRGEKTHPRTPNFSGQTYAINSFMRERDVLSVF